MQLLPDHIHLSAGLITVSMRNGTCHTGVGSGVRFSIHACLSARGALTGTERAS